MVHGIKINDIILKSTDMQNCINKNACMGCKKPYFDIILITKTGIGFCSKDCMEQFILQWRTKDNISDCLENHTIFFQESAGDKR